MHGCAIITGGGPGSVQAANEGAALAGPTAPGRSVGIRIHLPFEQDVTPFVAAADIEIPRCVDTAPEAIALLRRHRGDWVGAQRTPAQ